MSKAEAAIIDLQALAPGLPAWRSRLLGRVVGAGQLCLVPAGVPHAVEEGSAGTLLIMDN